MKEITEDYCSFEIAQLLKEKEFKEIVQSLWVGKDEYHYISTESIKPDDYNSGGTCLYSAPTHQMALKWLREVHKIFVEPFVAIDLNGKYHYCFRLLNSICKDILEPKDLVKIDFKDTYEEAVEAALKYSLENLI